jgi:hypothetical protein
MRSHFSTATLIASGCFVVACNGPRNTLTIQSPPTQGTSQTPGTDVTQDMGPGGNGGYGDAFLAILNVDIGNGASIQGGLSGSDDVTLLGAPTVFNAPLHVASVLRPGYAVHNRADLVAACAVPLAAGEVPSFSGTFLFDPLEQKFLDAAIVNSGAGKIEQLTTAHVTNTPTLTSAQSSEASFAPALYAALASPQHDAPYTSGNWTLLCSLLTKPPAITIDLVGSFDSRPYSGRTTLDSVQLDLN